MRARAAPRRVLDSEAHIRNVTAYMISSGIAKLGYTQINVDEVSEH